MASEQKTIDITQLSKEECIGLLGRIHNKVGNVITDKVIFINVESLTEKEVKDGLAVLNSQLWTPEKKEALSVKMKAQWTPERRAAMSNAMKGVFPPKTVTTPVETPKAETPKAPPAKQQPPANKR